MDKPCVICAEPWREAKINAAGLCPVCARAAARGAGVGQPPPPRQPAALPTPTLNVPAGWVTFTAYADLIRRSPDRLLNQSAWLEAAGTIWSAGIRWIDPKTPPPYRPAPPRAKSSRPADCPEHWVRLTVYAADQRIPHSTCLRAIRRGWASGATMRAGDRGATWIDPTVPPPTGRRAKAAHPKPKPRPRLTPPEGWITLEQAAKNYRRSVQTVRGWVVRGWIAESECLVIPRPDRHTPLIYLRPGAAVVFPSLTAR